MNRLFESYKRFYDEVNDVCLKSPVYRYTGLRPPSFVINCESEYEKQHVLRHMTDKYEKDGVLDFALAADKYLYCQFDGSLQQMKNTFSTIRSCAVTDNFYKYILGLDVTNLVSRYSENQCSEFFSRIAETSKYATCVFFISTFEAVNTERFVGKLRGNVKNLKSIAVSKFTYSDLASIAVNRISNEFSVRCTTPFELAFAKYLSNEGITNINDVFNVSEKLLMLADFSENPPTLDGAVFKKLNDGILQKRKEKPNNEIRKIQH